MTGLKEGNLTILCISPAPDSQNSPLAAGSKDNIVMQEYLIIKDEHADQHKLGQYKEKSIRFFRNFDLNFDSKIFYRKNIAAILLSKDSDNGNIIEDKHTGDFIAASGPWFFIEGFNRKINNLSILFGKLLKNTTQELSNIDGIFNFVVYDNINGSLKIITDRIGLKSVYCRKIGSAEFISSSALLLASLHPFEMDPIGLKEFLLANKCFGSTTLFKDIKKLDPASIIEYKAGTTSKSSYWSIYCGQPKRNLSTNEKVEEFTFALKNIMRSISQLYTYPFTDITGGWDSRTIIINMPGVIPKFAAVTSGKSDTEDDVVIGKQISNMFGIPHYFYQKFIGTALFSVEKYIEYLKRSLYLTDGAMSSPLYVNTLASHLRSISNGADLSLNGSGGELFRSYWWEPASLRNSDIKKGRFYVPGLTIHYNKQELVKRVMHQVSDLSIFTGDFDTDINGHLINIIDKINEPFMPISNVEQITNVYISCRMANWLAGYTKAANRLLDTLSPLLMSKPLEIAIELSRTEKRFGYFLRRFHEALNPELARIKTSYGYSTETLSCFNFTDYLPVIKKDIQYIKSKLTHKLTQKPEGTNIHEVLYLQPENMKLMEIFDKQKLAVFLEQAKQQNFAYSVLYHNIYTVEAILNIL